MSKLTKLAAIAALLGAAGTDSVWAEADDATALFLRLETEARDELLEPEEAAAILFAKEPRATTQLLGKLEQLRTSTAPRSSAAAKVESAVDRVPGVAAALLRSGGLGDGDAFRVASVALEIVGARSGAREDPSVLVRLLSGVAGRPGAVRLGKGVGRAVEALATEKGLDGPRLLRLVEASHPSLSRDVLGGAARRQLGNSIAFCLGRSSGADAVVLNQLQRAVQLGASVNADLVEGSVVPLLRSRVDFVRSEAALVLGRVGRRPQIEPLIRLLKDPSRLVRQSSHSALCDLTGMTIAGNHHRWTLWHREQLAWWDKGGKRLVASLPTVPRSRLVAALSSVATKRLYRAEISAQLVGMLNKSRPDEACAILAALGALRDPASLPGILELRNHPHPEVQASAIGALQSMRQAGIRVPVGRKARSL